MAVVVKERKSLCKELEKPLLDEIGALVIVAIPECDECNIEERLAQRYSCVGVPSNLKLASNGGDQFLHVLISGHEAFDVLVDNPKGYNPLLAGLWITEASEPILLVQI